MKLPQGERILQICHHSGTIKLDEVEPGEDCLKIEGVLEVTLLYLTSDDQAPVQPAESRFPLNVRQRPEGSGKTAYTSWMRGWNSSQP